MLRARRKNYTVRRSMPALDTIVRLYPERDLRCPEDKRLNNASRSHILGLEVASALLEATASPGGDTAATVEAVSMSLGAPDNFWVTNQPVNVERYHKGERELCFALRQGSYTSSLEARRVVEEIITCHTKNLRVMARCLPKKRCRCMVELLSTATNDCAHAQPCERESNACQASPRK